MDGRMVFLEFRLVGFLLVYQSKKALLGTVGVLYETHAHLPTSGATRTPRARRDLDARFPAILGGFSAIERGECTD